MDFKLVFLCFLVFYTVKCHPTMYKYNENNKLEPDLVPVSSTVIPLPVYKVSSGIDVSSAVKDDKIKKPEGPISLITVHTKKKPIPVEKAKHSDISIVKQVSKRDFDN